MARKAAFDRNEVLQKALMLFWEKGYQATSMKDLEKALKMHPGSIYSAFGSKDKLFALVLETYANASREALAQSIENAPSALEGLANHVRNIPKGGETPSKACLLVKTVLETSTNNDELRGKAEKHLCLMEEAIRKVFEEAKKIGKLSPDADPALLACRLQSEIVGLRTFAQRSDSKDKAEMLAEEIARELENL